LKAHSSTQLLPHPRTPIGTPLLCERQVMLLYKSHKFLAERALRSVKKARDRHATYREITKAKRRTPLHSLGANRHGHEKDAQDDNERTILYCTTRRLPAVLVGDASRGYSWYDFLYRKLGHRTPFFFLGTESPYARPCPDTNSEKGI
jgi:hypothetical protein